MGKLKNFFIMGIATLFLFNTISGCSQQRMDLEDELNDEILNQVNMIETMYSLGNKYSSFAFTGADFVLDGNYYDVGVNGIATTEDKMHYVSLKYKVECEFLKDIDKSLEDDVILALRNIVNQYDFKAYNRLEVKSLDEISQAGRVDVYNEIDGYALDKSFVYGIYDLEFNKEDNRVSFMISQNAEYKGEGKNVKRCTSRHKVTLYCTAEEFNQLKSDRNLILSHFVDVVKNNETDKYSISRKFETLEKEFNDGSPYSSKEINK